MNCQEFQERLGEIASGHCSKAGPDASLQQQAKAHAARCKACAARRQAQQALNERLREFAAATSQLPAPHVRQRLQAAFAEQRQVAATPVAPVVDLAAARAAREHLRIIPRLPRWLGLAAAAVLALLTVSLVFWQRVTSLTEPGQRQEFTQAVPSPSPLLLPPPVTPPPAFLTQAQTSTLVKAVAHRATRHKRELETALAQEETSSEFVPLTLAVDERALENRTLVRLEVPRARLVALGLPLTVHGDREMVNAEVMMGDNGVAYAIRLVR